MAITLFDLVNKTDTYEKGESLLILPDDYVVLDLETTGLDPKVDEIIEIGAVRVRNDEIVKEFSTLVKPAAPIGDFTTELTGITNKMVADAPILKDVLGKFMAFVDEDIVMGHNVSFDVNFLIAGCEKCFKRGFSNDYVDTMRISRKLYPKEKHHKLCDLEARFNLHNEHAHRALSDVMLTKQAYDHMKNYVLSSGLSLRDLMYKNKHEI